MTLSPPSSPPPPAPHIRFPLCVHRSLDLRAEDWFQIRTSAAGIKPQTVGLAFSQTFGCTRRFLRMVSCGVVRATQNGMRRGHLVRQGRRCARSRGCRAPYRVFTPEGSPGRHSAVVEQRRAIWLGGGGKTKVGMCLGFSWIVLGCGELFFRYHNCYFSCGSFLKVGLCVPRAVV